MAACNRFSDRNATAVGLHPFPRRLHVNRSTFPLAIARHGPLRLLNMVVSPSIVMGEIRAKFF